jgi:1-acyl-sn-glycerol-3-phosphate acyltransferase
MKKVPGIILEDILKWESTGSFPNVKKSVTIFAPHTSYWDGFIGKLYLMNSDLNYKFLSKKEFFKFPLGYFFKAYGSIPVSRNKEYIDEIVKIFNKEESVHIVLSPEGQLAKTDHWKKGFFYMAQRANVPIVVAYIDYKKKEIGLKGIITDTNDINNVFHQISKMYEKVNAKYPNEFCLDKRYS